MIWYRYSNDLLVLDNKNTIFQLCTTSNLSFMNYQIKIQENHPLREQLETVIRGLLTFIDAGSVYVSLNEAERLTIVTFILKKNSGQHGGMLERHSDKLTTENPNVIFRFLNEVIVSQGFKEGNLFLTNHCTLSELVYYQNSNKIFSPLKTDPEKLTKKAYTHQDIIREPAIDSYNEAISSIAKGEYVKAAAQFYNAIWILYACYTEFLTGSLEEQFEYPSFDEVYETANRYAPKLKNILDIESKAGLDLILSLRAAYTSIHQKYPVPVIDSTLLEVAEAKYQHLLAELENYNYRFSIRTEAKLNGINKSHYGNASILTQKLTSNYFVDHALSEISQTIQDFIKVRAVYCFGYSIIENDLQKKQKPFSRTLPGYHYYLLVLNREYKQNSVAELQALIRKKFSGRYTVTILQHKAQHLRKQALNQKHFINAVVANGLEVYNSPLSPFYQIPVATGRDIKFTKNYWNNRMLVAQGFLTLVQDEYPDELPILINAMLQQAIQQIAVGVLDLFLSYHPNIYSTNYLLRLLDCIPKLPKLFIDSEEDRRLRQLLSANIDMLKHKNPEQETIEDSSKLYKKCKDFYNAILVAGSKELERLEQTAPTGNNDMTTQN